MRGIIGIDIGTTHIKTGLVSETGEILCLEREAALLTDDGWGQVCCPRKLWDLIGKQLERIRRQTACRITGIVVTGMAEAGLILDRDKECEITDILLWYDSRTEHLAGKMPREEEAEVFSRTGLRDSFKYGIYKFLWLLEEKKADRQTAVWLSVCDYVVWKLTGRLVTDPTFAARTYVYDIVDGRWAEERIRSYGLTTDNFPDVEPSGSIIGNTYLESVGSVPVAIGGHDHVCAAFGLLQRCGADLCDSAGTSETYLGFMEKMPERGFAYDSGILYGPSVDQGWFFLANVPSSGHSIEWFRKKLQRQELHYEEMNRHLEQMDQKPTGILYYPYLTGMGSPLYRPDISASIWGIREEMDTWVILKGIMEGIQYQAAWILEIMQQAGIDTGGDLVCAGGSVNNHALMQIKADILRRRIYVPKVYEATLQGAVLLFLYKNNMLHRANSNGETGWDLHGMHMPEYDEIYVPDRQRAEEYEAIRKERYMALIENLRRFI